MPVQRAKSLDTLYSDVGGYDIVVVPDAPLASALARRLDRPFFGTFATTPRRLAAGRRETAEERTAFLELVEEVDAGWKATAHAVGNVLQCWEHQGSADAILEYDAYVDETTRSVVEAMAGVRTTSRRLTEYAIDDGQSVAVVGYDQFTRLERSVLPDEFDAVESFTDESFDLPPFHVFESPGAIVDALLDTITPGNAHNVAVILDDGSAYSSLVEAAFEAAGIPFYGGPGFADDPDHRSFLQLLRAAYRGPDLTVGDVRPLLARLGADVAVEHDEKRLDACGLADLEWMTEFRSAVDGWTFERALAAYEARVDRSLAALRAELRRLGLLAAPVSRQAVDDLAFYLDTYEVPVDRDEEGVLLADAKSAGYVDRPVVFYVGLDEDWTHTVPRRPWIDATAQFQRHLRGFQRLLQSGDEQYFLVQDTAGGQPVTPCLYFDELLATEFERFRDLESVSHTRVVGRDDGGFAPEDTDVAPGTVETISQSSLNTYVNCPREYLFDRVLDSPEAGHLLEGTLFHDFAELYANHPDRVDEDAVAEAVEVMLDEVAPFYADADRTLRRRKYRIGLETIVEFLDERPPTDGEFSTSKSGPGENVLAEYFELPVDSPATERWFENADLGIEGTIDLVHAPDRLLDYKSSSKKRATQVVGRSAVDPPDDTPDFQAALYLCHYRTVRPDQRLAFAFLHFLETLDEAVRGEADIEDALTTVTYVKESFEEFVASEEAYEILLDGYSDCRATFADLGYEDYSAIVAERSFPETTDREELRASAFAESFTRAVDERTIADVDAEKGCDQAIRALAGVRKRRYFREDLDAVEAFVERRLAELNRRRAGDERFPVEGPGGEPNYRRVDYRDLLLEGP